MYFVIHRRVIASAAVLLMAASCLLFWLGAAVPTMSGRAPEGIELPILMYHSIIKNSARQGDYVLSPDVLEQDFKYLSDQGYTTISAAELIAHVYEGQPLPDKPVMLTFDDGFLNNLTYAVPLLEKYDMCTVINVVGSYTEQYAASDDHNPAYAYLSYDDICEAAASGYIEIGNHSYDMHRKDIRDGTARKLGESKEDYKQTLYEDLKKVQDAIEANCGFAPVVFAYPFGRVDRTSYEVIENLGFKISLGCGEVVNIITDDPKCLYHMGRFNRPAGISTEDFMRRIA